MPERETRPSELLYDAVACAMWLYVKRTFRVVVLGREHLRMRPGMIVVSTHRSDADVPLLGSSLVFSDRMLFRHRLRPHYAARDDLWEQGVLAALVPPSTPLALRRMLFRLGLSPYLARVRAHPLRISAEAQAVQVLREASPTAPIDEVLPATLASRFHERGAALVEEALRPEHADLLWTDVDRHEIPQAHQLWQFRAHGAAADLRRLIGVVRSGKPLLIFPEGEPSPDGAIGPLHRGLDVLVRYGKPSALLPVGIAYDVLTPGRPRVCVDVGQPLAQLTDDLGARVLDELRKRTPLMCGQVVAHRLLAIAEAGESSLAPGELDAALAIAFEEARAEGRGVEPLLVEADTRRRRLSDCLLALGRRGVLSAPKAGRLLIDRDRLGSDPMVARAAVEYASAREAVAASRRN